METSWDAMKHYAMTGSLGLGEAEAAQYATEHLATDVIQNNIFNADPTQLFDANGNLTASVKPGYTDLDWEDNVERTGNRQEYNLDGNYTSDKVSVYSSIGYLKENGYIVGSDFERYTGRVNTTFTPNKWITSGLNVNASISKRHFNDNANGTY